MGWRRRGGAFWLACGFVVLLVLVEMARWFAPKGDERARRGCLAALLTRPRFAVLVLFLPCILLVRCDLGGTDVPDILTTTRRWWPGPGEDPGAQE